RRAGDDHEIGLAGRGADHLGAEAGDVMGGGEGGGHLHVTAGETEVVRPQGVFATPVDRPTQHLLEFPHEDVPVDLVFQWVAYRLPLTDWILLVGSSRIDPGKVVSHCQSLIVSASPAARGGRWV